MGNFPGVVFFGPFGWNKFATDGIDNVRYNFPGIEFYGFLPLLGWIDKFATGETDVCNVRYIAVDWPTVYDSVETRTQIFSGKLPAMICPAQLPVMLLSP